jgi:hypothetical protein
MIHLDGTLNVLRSTRNGELCFRDLLDDTTTREHLAVDLEDGEIFFRGTNVALSRELPIENGAIEGRS